MSEIPEIILNSGRKMPLLGMGTATLPFPPEDLVKSSVLAAIELGYRHFDTAHIYKTEAPLGQAISEALRSRLVANRDEFFVTTKLWSGHSHPDLVLPALRESLTELGLDYVDLYLIHFPVRFNQRDMTVPLKKEDILPLDLKGTWQAMEECCRLGLAKSIGVSNFTCKKLSELLSFATIPPAVNQVEMHPVWQQQILRDFCKEKGIHVTAYAPLGGNIAVTGVNMVSASKDMKQIAEAKGKSIAQICLRWAYEQGISFVPKSYNKERLKQNMEIFDWQLNHDELMKISLIPQTRTFSGQALVSEDGLFKSLSDLWDGEI